MPKLSPAELMRLRRSVGILPSKGISPHFQDANTRRTIDAAMFRVELAKVALERKGEGYLTPLQAEVLAARVAYPRDSLAELADRIGRTKHSVSSALRLATNRVR